MKNAMKNKERLIDIINNFDNKKILIIGDIMIDEYVFGSANRLSPEAPVPVVLVEKQKYLPGGASNVLHNIYSLSGTPILTGIIGDDLPGKELRMFIEERNIHTDGLIVDSERPTTLKTRIISENQHIVRIDREISEDIHNRTLDKLLSKIEEKIKKVDAIIISDYAKGDVTKEVIEFIQTFAHKENKIVSVDPQVRHFNRYKGLTLMTPNKKEASEGIGIPIRNDIELENVGNKILKNLNLDYLLITLGKEGMALFRHNKEMEQIPTVAINVYDVTGAGDTVISALTLALASGATIEEASVIANYAAGIVVGYVGTAVCSKAELINTLINT